MRHATRRMTKLLGLGGRLMCAGAAACTSGDGRALRVGTTHTVEQSGALALLDSLWRGPAAAIVVGPSGQILRAAAAGDLDVVITHAPSLGQRILVAPGHAALACPLVESRFAVVGPAADPAGARGATSAREAFARIARAQHPFVSRGDSSGTHVKELAIWRAAGIERRDPAWYLESGADQATALRIAVERRGYALADLPTLTREQGNVPELSVVFQNDTVLRNPYTLYVVGSAEPRPEAGRFAAWAVDTWRTRLTELELSDGTRAFAPATGGCVTPRAGVLP